MNDVLIQLDYLFKTGAGAQLIREIMLELFFHRDQVIENLNKSLKAIKFVPYTPRKFFLKTNDNIYKNVKYSYFNIENI
jgi:hypothetical protein